MNTDLDGILENLLRNSDKEDNINNILKISENVATEQEILNSVLELSKKETTIENTHNFNNHPSIQFIVEMGFTIEEAVLAYSAVGEDPELMLQYLYSLML